MEETSLQAKLQSQAEKGPALISSKPDQLPHRNRQGPIPTPWARFLEILLGFRSLLKPDKGKSLSLQTWIGLSHGGIGRTLALLPLCVSQALLLALWGLSSFLNNRRAKALSQDSQGENTGVLWT